MHVWCLELTQADESFCAHLLPGELRKAASFRSEEHRWRYRLTRSVLRLLLGSYLCEDPAEIEVRYGKMGKPFVDDPNGLKFNVAHSADIAVYAFSGMEVGIDVEKRRAIRNPNEIAERFFHRDEVRDLAPLSGEAKDSAFHRCWVRKEAYIKAVGGGLSIPLDSFCVSVLPNDPPAIREIVGQPGEPSCWGLFDLPLTENYAAALAVRAKEITLWQSAILPPRELIAALRSRAL